MKLVALAITVALWLGVTGLSTQETRRLTSIPLSLRYSNNIEVTNSPPDKVSLLVTGDKRKLESINDRDLTVSVDISDLAPGNRTLTLLPENVSVALPTGVRLDEIQPRSIPIRIEAVVEKDVDVKPQLSGTLPEGYEVYSEIVNPKRVRVRGPSSFIRSLEFLSTEPIDLSGRTSAFAAQQIPIGISDPKASLPTDTVVDVTIRIGEKRVERVYSVPLSDGSGRRAIVTLYGAASLFEDVRPSDLRINIAKNDRGEDDPRVTLPIALDGQVEVRSIRLRG